MKSLPLLLRRVRKQEGSATLPEIRSLTGIARSVDHDRWAARTTRIGLRDQIRDISKRKPRSDRAKAAESVAADTVQVAH
jgi:hypothetical protein